MTTQATHNVLLTGATGFVGRELLWRLLRAPENRVVCLIRGQDASESAARLNAILDQAQPNHLTPEERCRATVLPGDLTRERLGLEPGQWDQLSATTTRIVHGAANVNWALPLDGARRINVEGTRRVVELGQAAHARGVLRTFDYLSTCHVCGRRRGLILEADLDGTHGFFNSYEQSKFEAEQLVRSSGLAYATFRLSMVVGDSRTGYASTFKVMYWPLKMLARGLARAVPADRRGKVDLVPVDYLCDALETLARDPAQRSKTFHLAAGPGHSSTIGELLDLAVTRFRVRPPLLIPPGIFNITLRPLLHLAASGRRRELLKKGRVYKPYLAFRASFDNCQTREALEPLGIRPPRVQDYFERLIDYALASNWGQGVVESA